MALKCPLLVSCDVLLTHETVFETDVTTLSCHDECPAVDFYSYVWIAHEYL